MLLSLLLVVVVSDVVFVVDTVEMSVLLVVVVPALDPQDSEEKTGDQIHESTRLVQDRV